MESAIFDADSHLMETPEWLGTFAEASVRDRLAPLGLEGAGAGAAKLMASLPEVWESHRHQEIGADVLRGPKGWMAPGALDVEVRSRVLDALGIDAQLVFPTFALGHFARSKDFPVLHHSPERFLACMALDGVFERHPTLRGAAIELGATWVPGLLRNLDHAHRSFSKFEPVLQDLPLLPSEYIRRQVRFTPFPFEDTAWLVDQCGPELFMFSTDYPHPEGGKRPFEAFGEAVAGFDEATRERFFWRNGAELLGLA